MDFAARHPGSFLPLQLAVADRVRERLGLDTVIALPERARKRSWVAGIPAAGHGLAFLPASARRRPRALLGIARRARARLLHAHFVWFDLDCLLAGRRLGVPVVWHLHNGLEARPLRQRAADLVKVRALGRGCDLVIAVSEHVRQDGLLRGFPPAKLSVVENALPADRLTPAARPQRAGPPRVLAYCWPPRRKGADVLAAALRRTGLDATLVGEPPLVPYLERTAGGVPARATIQGPVDDVAGLLARHDVFASAAREEGFPLAVGEAMAAALPVVAADIPGMAPFASAPGLLRCPVDDAGALAARLDELRDPAVRERLGDGNRAWALEHLAPERYVEATVDHYAALLAR
jgi:glycosyltransferase involved in cell wall biosynthesis